MKTNITRPVSRGAGITPRLLALLAVPALLPAGAALAQRPTLLREVTAGSSVTRIVSPSDTTQSYAVYLPSAYDTLHSWPIAFLMDPRGRAMIPMQALVPVAEKLGYILISSYNTISDTTDEPNVAAVNAMLDDTRRDLHIDQRRIYLIGFSGTARLSWNFASELAPHVAGIFGAGGSGAFFEEDAKTKGPPPVVFYGTAGRHDFNFDELQAFEPWLISNGLSYRIREFDGVHQWPPDSLMRDAFEWFDLKAMQRQMKPIDPAYVAMRYARDTARARSLESAKQWVDALRAWREIQRDYERLEPVALVTAHADSLAEAAPLKRAYTRVLQRMQVYAAYQAHVQVVLNAVAAAPHAPTAASIYRDLGIAKIKDAEAHAHDPADAAAEERKLQIAAVNLLFYYPRDMVNAGKPDYALAFLDAAELLRAGSTKNLPVRATAERMLKR